MPKNLLKQDKADPDRYGEILVANSVGKVGAICGQGFTWTEADVLCKHLGYNEPLDYEKVYQDTDKIVATFSCSNQSIEDCFVNDVEDCFSSIKLYCQGNSIFLL